MRSRDPVWARKIDLFFGAVSVVTAAAALPIIARAATPQGPQLLLGHTERERFVQETLPCLTLSARVQFCQQFFGAGVDRIGKKLVAGALFQLTA